MPEEHRWNKNRQVQVDVTGAERPFLFYNCHPKAKLRYDNLCINLCIERLSPLLDLKLLLISPFAAPAGRLRRTY